MSKRVAVIQDISGLGRCSLAAALPVLSIMGIQCCPVPTAVLTNQTEFSAYASLDCGELMQQFPAMWSAHGIALDGIYTGFMSGAQQLAAAQEMIDTFHAQDSLLLIDPVLGDNGALYPCFDAAFCSEMRRFAAQADILTPNVTEACILAGESYSAFVEQDTAAQAAWLQRICEALPAKTIVVTGWRKGGMVCNAAWQAGVFTVHESAAVPGSYSGTGDLFAATLYGGLLRGDGLDASIRRAMRLLSLSLRSARHQGRPETEGVPFELHLKELLA